MADPGNDTVYAGSGDDDGTTPPPRQSVRRPPTAHQQAKAAVRAQREREELGLEEDLLKKTQRVRARVNSQAQPVAPPVQDFDTGKRSPWLMRTGTATDISQIGASSPFNVENSPGAARKWVEQQEQAAAESAKRFKVAVSAATVAVAVFSAALDQMNSKQKIGAMTAAEQNRSIGESVRTLGGSSSDSDKLIKDINSGAYGKLTIAEAAQKLDAMAAGKPLGMPTKIGGYLAQLKASGSGKYSSTDLARAAAAGDNVLPGVANPLLDMERLDPNDPGYGLPEVSRIALMQQRDDAMNRQTMRSGLSKEEASRGVARAGQESGAGALLNWAYTASFMGVRPGALVEAGLGDSSIRPEQVQAGQAFMGMGGMMPIMNRIERNTRPLPISVNSQAGRDF